MESLPDGSRKDHRVVSTQLKNNEITIELDAKKGRRLPWSVCGRRSRVKDRVRVLRWRHVSLWGNCCSVEAMNNNAKAISHRARGYQSEHTFSLALIHGL